MHAHRPWTFVILLPVLLGCALPRQSAAQETPPQDDTTLVTVTSVDGDTLLLSDGERVRMIGVHIVETLSSDESPGEFARKVDAFTDELVHGEELRLEFDQVNAATDHRDKFGRVLAYVFRERDALDLNLELIRKGYARVYAKNPFFRLEEFSGYERLARLEKRGLWESETSQGETTVYVTSTGRQFHTDGCPYISSSRIPMPLSKARVSYVPCSVCGAAACLSAPILSPFPYGRLSGLYEGRLDNGGTYRGQVRDRVPHGFGIYELPDGGKYLGEFEAGKPHGYGSWTRPDGSRYVGEWKDNQMHGAGIYMSPFGGKINGEWREDKVVSCRGTRVAKEGRRLSGDWWDDGRAGKGVILWPDGRRYEGEWADPELTDDDLPHGQGTMQWPDGRRYVGSWEAGRMHGAGTMTSPDGTKREGIWHRSEFFGDAEPQTATARS